MPEIKLPTVDLDFSSITENLGFWVCVILGIIFLFSSLVKLAITKIKFTCTIEAKLTKYVEMYSRNKVRYSPVYTYHYNKCDYNHTSNGWSATKKYEMGKTIKLHINPERPSEVRGSSLKDIMFLVIGLFLVLLAVVYFLPMSN